MNFYSFVQKFSLCSFLFASMNIVAMDNNNDNNNTDTKIAAIHRDYDALRANRPSLNRANPSPIDDIELYIQECKFVSEEADKYGENEIACDLKKK